MEKYLLTIAIPTLNRAQMLKESIDKILKYNNGKFEVLISDNGSTDNTYELCKDYEEKYDFFHYHKNEKNEGFDYNYRNCIKKSIGKYVFVLSDDDLISNSFIQNIFPILEKGDMDLIALNLKGFALNTSDINEYDGK